MGVVVAGGDIVSYDVRRGEESYNYNSSFYYHTAGWADPVNTLSPPSLLPSPPPSPRSLPGGYQDLCQLNKQRGQWSQLTATSN